MNIFAKADLKKLKKLFESSFSSSAFLVIAARCVYLLFLSLYIFGQFSSLKILLGEMLYLKPTKLKGIGSNPIGISV